MFFASRRINFRNYPQSMWFVLFLCVWLLQHNVCARGVSHTQVESRPAPDHGRCQSLVFLGASPPKRMEIRPRSGHERYLIYIKESEVVWFFRLQALGGLNAVFLHLPRVAGGQALKGARPMICSVRHITMYCMYWVLIGS